MSDALRELLAFIQSRHVATDRIALTRLCMHMAHLLTDEQRATVLRTIKP